jgi:hypothetical protein
VEILAHDGTLGAVDVRAAVVDVMQVEQLHAAILHPAVAIACPEQSFGIWRWWV